MPAKYIFVTGGVVSSLGKGICVASVGRILKSRGLSVSVLKLDPYLNVDPGTMSPYQHGEVFVTQDGGETDLDLGHYERFIDLELTRSSNLTAGDIYMNLIAKERRGDFLGGTIQSVPHVTNDIKERILRLANDSGADVIVVEVGGTVGDIEGLPFLEAIRTDAQPGRERQRLLHPPDPPPYLSAAQELKTKPTQHSVKELRSIGIQPRRHHLPQRPPRTARPLREDFLLLRCAGQRCHPPGDGAERVQRSPGTEKPGWATSCWMPWACGTTAAGWPARRGWTSGARWWR